MTIYKDKDIITWCDEVYRIRKSYGDRGVVEYLDGELATNDFHYDYGGEHAVLVMTAEEAEGLSVKDIFDKAQEVGGK